MTDFEYAPGWNLMPPTGGDVDTFNEALGGEKTLLDTVFGGHDAWWSGRATDTSLVILSPGQEIPARQDIGNTFAETVRRAGTHMGKTSIAELLEAPVDEPPLAVLDSRTLPSPEEMARLSLAREGTVIGFLLVRSAAQTAARGSHVVGYLNPSVSSGTQTWLTPAHISGITSRYQVIRTELL